MHGRKQPAFVESTRKHKLRTLVYGFAIAAVLLCRHLRMAVAADFKERKKTYCPPYKLCVFLVGKAMRPAGTSLFCLLKYRPCGLPAAQQRYRYSSNNDETSDRIFPADVSLESLIKQNNEQDIIYNMYGTGRYSRMPT